LTICGVLASRGPRCSTSGGFSLWTTFLPSNPMACSSVLLWTENEVIEFFNALGFDQFEASVKQHGITGDVLIHLHHETLRDLGFHSVVSDTAIPGAPLSLTKFQGSRLRILRAIYDVKLRDGVPIEQDHWSPQCRCVRRL
jgi:hypothetical protein